MSHPNEDLAALAGLTPGRVSAVRRGAVRVSDEEVDRLCIAIDFHPDLLWMYGKVEAA